MRVDKAVFFLFFVLIDANCYPFRSENVVALHLFVSVIGFQECEDICFETHQSFFFG